LIPDVDDLPQRLEGLGLVKVSEDMLDGHIYTGTYSIPVNLTLSKPDTVLEKRAENIEGARCLTMCAPAQGVIRPNPNDCRVLYNRLYTWAGQFTVEARTSPSLPQDHDTRLTHDRLDFVEKTR